MSARVEARRLPAAWVVVAAGMTVLLLRPFATAQADTRVVLLAASYIALGLASIAVPAERALERSRPYLAPAPVLVVGVVAVAVAATAGGTPVPIPWAASALPLSLCAAVAEEALFRRVAFGRLERWGPVIAIGGSAVLFGLVHVPAYGAAALPVDVGAGLLFGWQRWASGTWTVPAATHAVANVMAVLG